MVMPICADEVVDMFPKQPWNFTSYSANCRKQYGVDAEKYKALILFGGEQIRSASNIIFSNGLRDPWSAGGVLKSLSDTLIAIQIPGACHHEDLRATGKLMEKHSGNPESKIECLLHDRSQFLLGPKDPEVLKAARAKEIKIIREWIDNYYVVNGIDFDY